MPRKRVRTGYMYEKPKGTVHNPGAVVDLTEEEFNEKHWIFDDPPPDPKPVEEAPAPDPPVEEVAEEEPPREELPAEEGVGEEPMKAEQKDVEGSGEIQTSNRAMMEPVRRRIIGDPTPRKTKDKTKKGTKK